VGFNALAVTIKTIFLNVITCILADDISDELTEYIIRVNRECSSSSETSVHNVLYITRRHITEDSSLYGKELFSVKSCKN